MDYSILMRHVYGLCECAHNRSGLTWRLRNTLQLFRQTDAINKLHREVWPAIVIAHVVDLHDIRVPEACHGLGFTHETLFFCRRGTCTGKQHLDRYWPPETNVPGLEHNAHSAAAENTLHVIPRYLRKFNDRPHRERNTWTWSGFGRGEQCADLGLNRPHPFPALANRRQ